VVLGLSEPENRHGNAPMSQWRAPALTGFRCLAHSRQVIAYNVHSMVVLRRRLDKW
jgi:hypothetical protein